jgi:hypothetical protein
MDSGGHMSAQATRRYVIESVTEYTNCVPKLCTTDYFPTRAKARKELARIVRRCYRDLDTVVLRGGNGQFLITNALGPMIFERALCVVGID